MPEWGFAAISLTFFAIIIVIIVNVRKTGKRRKQCGAAQLQTDLQTHAAISVITLPHFSGLPVPENTPCQVYSSDEEYKIVASGQQFCLLKSKITDITITTSTEIQKQYISSAGGAVGGGLLFGPVGALIGGRTKEKKTREVTDYLILSYQDAGESKYLAFIVTGITKAAQQCVDDFKKANTGAAKPINL